MTHTAVRCLLGLLFVLMPSTTSQAMESDPEDVYDDQWPEHPIDDEQVRRSFATMNVKARELPAEEKQRIQKEIDDRERSEAEKEAALKAQDREKSEAEKGGALKAQPTRDVCLFCHENPAETVIMTRHCGDCIQRLLREAEPARCQYDSIDSRQKGQQRSQHDQRQQRNARWGALNDSPTDSRQKGQQRSQQDQRQQRNDRWGDLDDSPTDSRQKGQQRSQHDQRQQRNDRWGQQRSQQRSRQGHPQQGLQELWGALPKPGTTAEAILDKLREDENYRERFVKAAICDKRTKTTSLQLGLEGQYPINLDAFLSDNKELANVPMRVTVQSGHVRMTPLEYAVFMLGAPNAVRILLIHGAKLTTEHYLAEHYRGTTAIARAKRLVAQTLEPQGRGESAARIQASFIRDIAKHIVENPTEFSEEEIAQAEESRNFYIDVAQNRQRH